MATMAGERIKTSSSASRDNWFSYRNPPFFSPVSRYCIANSPTWVPRLDIDVAFHASAHTLHFAFLSICSFNLAYSLHSALFRFAWLTARNHPSNLSLRARCFFLGPLAIRVDDVFCNENPSQNSRA